jgi:hypothetical protein
MGDSGYYGLAQGYLQPGDLLALLYPEVYVPFVIRKKDSKFEIVEVVFVPESLWQDAASSAGPELVDMDFLRLGYSCAEKKKTYYILEY